MLPTPAMVLPMAPARSPESTGSAVKIGKIRNATALGTTGCVDIAPPVTADPTRLECSLMIPYSS